MQGIVFNIRNEIGNQLYELLNDITEPSWYWRTGHGESYFAGYEKRFFIADTVMEDRDFITHLATGEHYLIFVDLKVFPSLNTVREINNYKEFMESSCLFSLLVIDSVQVIAIAKNNQLISHLSERASILGYTSIEPLKDDELKGLLYSVWGE